MAALWRRADDGYERLQSAGFPDEAQLHALVAAAPQLLPLSGTPDLVVLGQEVSVGNGYADVLAVEPSGRFVLIEVKLAKNSEARRAIVAQVLSYASFLKGTDLSALEQGALAKGLQEKGQTGIAALVSEAVQDTFSMDDFRRSMQESLDSGAFRLVFVLDSAPVELVSLVGYLESIAPEVVIDLVTVAQYQLGKEEVIVPQRVDPGRAEPAGTPGSGSSGHTVTTPGVDDFVASIEVAREEERPVLRRLADWVMALESQGLARPVTTTGTTGRKSLKPWLRDEDVGLVTIWNENGKAGLTLWRSVFERVSPSAISRIETATGKEMGTGRSIYDFSDDILALLADAYREACGNAAKSTPTEA